MARSRVHRVKVAKVTDKDWSTNPKKKDKAWVDALGGNI